MNSEFPNGLPEHDPIQGAKQIGLILLLIFALGSAFVIIPRGLEWLATLKPGPHAPACDVEPTGNLWQKWDLETARQNTPIGMNGTLCAAWITQDISTLERIAIGETSLADISTITNMFGLIKFTPGTPETQGNYALGTVQSARSGTFAFAYTTYTGSSPDTFKTARLISVLEVQP
jgi:hypothetical protein